VRIALDTNVLAYAEGVGDEARRLASLRLVRQLPVSAVVLPAQCLGELFRVLTGKTRRDAASVKGIVLSWSDAYDVADTTWTAFLSAMEAVENYGLQIWDALILAVAVEQRCRILLSEDMQHGFTWRGITIVNPYSEPEHHLLQDLPGNA
jgi:predicted nucleic acid-binding protein